MSQKHAYLVAGYRFELEGEIPALSNLEPFVTGETDAPLLFSLQLVNSLPLIPTQVEVELLAEHPKVQQEEIDRIKAELRDYTERVNSGSWTFSSMRGRLRI